MSTEHLLGDISAVLNALMGTEDQSRQEAEAHLRRLTVQQPAEVLLLLTQIGSQGVGGFQLDHRLLTLILLKRLAFTPLPNLFLNDQAQYATAPFDVIRETTRGRIETVLCAGLRDEMDIRMRKGLGACAAGWAQESAVRHRPLLALPPVLLELTTSQHPFHRFTPFQLLDMTPTLLVDSVTDPFPAQQLAQIILAGLNDPSVDVRVEAMKALRSVMIQGVTGKEREEIGAQLVHQAFKTLPRLPANLLTHALLPLVELASNYPHLFIPALDDILPYLLSLLSPPGESSYPFSSYPKSTLSFDEWEEVANPATEIILSLAELRPIPMADWQNGRLSRELIGLLIGRQVMSLEPDCQNWLEETNLEDEDEDYPLFSEEALDRLAMALGGETVLPPISEHVQGLLSQQDWRCKYCALVGIAAIAEGCLEELTPRIRDVLTIVSPTAKDPHPRVRYGFLQCIGQLCSDCEGVMQTEFAKPTLEVCLELLNDSVTRVKAHAAACLTNFFQNAELEHFLLFLDPLIHTLMTFVQSGPQYVQEQALATISNILSQADRASQPYYREVMDLLFQIVASSNEPSQRRLQGRAIECAAMTGLAVGKLAFSTDAVKVAQLFIGIQNTISQTDDIRSGYLMEAWANLCRTLKTDFEPFLVHVVPPLLKAASHQPPKTPKSASDVLGEDENEEADGIIASTANTAEMDDKIAAYENLTTYAYELEGTFAPWLGASMELALEGLGDPHLEDVRVVAATLVPGLLQVAKSSGAWRDQPDNLIQVFQRLVEAMKSEQEWSYLAILYKSLTDSIHVISLSPPPELTTSITHVIQDHLDSLMTIRKDRENMQEYMDESDLEMYQLEQDDEDGCLTQVDKLVHMLIKVGSQQGGFDGNGFEELKALKRVCGDVKKAGMKSHEPI